ncbi:vacuolar protein sorting 13C isoform X2 [Lycorma delicatula]|uniref:vacuolar protein sorting 13C isoform X2 n=1 Tax=Lycorma delicatula TaxID=130591 RepID=UPI003F514682
MVFQSIALNLLNKTLGEYVENLDSSQLQIGIWGGDVVFTNLKLKQSALNDLNLPFKTVYGHLGKLVLKIPWKNLYSAPTEASIEKLFLLVVPHQEIKYDPEKEEKWKQEAKQAEIAKVEAAKKRELEKDQPKTDDTFAEKLVAQIIRNVQISIKDIHIRFEDKVTDPSSPFALGITLHNLTVITTDKNWFPSISQDRIGYIFKHLTIDGLSVYWNSNTQLFGRLADEKLIFKEFQSGIPSKGQLIEGYNYMVGPISCAAKLQLNMKPESDDFKIPKAILHIELENVEIKLSKAQYSDIFALLESLDRMSRASLYRKYRPEVSTYKENYKTWWKYAYSCILEEEVRRKHRDWDWTHIFNHRKICRQYANAYQNKLIYGGKDYINEITNCEQYLDAFNIVLIRQKVEMEVEREGKKKKDTKQQKSWFSGWWSKEVSEEETPSSGDIKKQFQEAMTSEEKEKLFKAIGYQENLAPDDYPVEFVAVKLTFSLHCLEIQIRDEKAVKPQVMVISLNEVTLQCQQRPSANGLSVEGTMHELAVTGLEQNNINPQICSSLDLEQNSNSQRSIGDTHLINFLFELNPLMKDCDINVDINFRPLKVIYDAQTINKLVDIFTPHEDKSALVYQLQMAANMKLAEVKEKSALGLQYTIQQHSRLNLKIDVMASYVIIPYSGLYSESEMILVYNVGRLSVKTKGRQSLTPSVKAMYKSGRKEDEILETMMSESYDKFELKIEDIQIILAHPGEPWRKTLENYENSELHLLHPTTLFIEVHKCLVSDDPRLPKLKIIGTLPNITLRIQEKRLFDTISLLLSIPFSETKPKPVPEDPYSGINLYGSSSSIFKLGLDKELDYSRRKLKSINYTSEEEMTQFTDLDARFQLNEIVIELLQKESSKGDNKPFLTLKVMTVEANLVMQTYNMCVSLLVGGLSVTQIYLNNLIRMISTPMTTGESDYLFQFKYTLVDKTSPDFRTYHKSVLQLIEMNFSKLNALVHQEALLYMIHWLNNIQVLMNSSSEEKSEIILEEESYPSLKEVKSSHSRLFVIKETSSKSFSGRKSKKKPVETIDLKLKAAVSEIGITLANNEYQLARLEIKGGVGSVLVKRSYTQMDVKIADIKVIDFKNSVHPKILSILGKEELITAQIVIFNEEWQRKGDHVSMSISANVACVRVVFLNRFLTSVMNFMSNFQTAQEAIIEASAAAAEAAKVNMQQAYSAALKIKINFNLKAPVVIIPVNSQSYDAILVDLGNLTITNSFQDVTVTSKEDHTAVLDHIQLTLDNVKISRIVIDAKENFEVEKPLLQPISFKLLVQRNLSTSWFTDVPDLDIGGRFDTIHIILKKEDYVMLMTVLSKNFGESDEKTSVPVTTRSVSSGRVPSKQIVVVPSDRHKSVTEESGRKSTIVARKEVSTTVKFTFRLESIIVELFDFDIRSSSKTTIKEYSLAKLEVYLLSLKGSLLSDGTFTSSALLLDFLVDDTRPSQLNKINRYMERVPIELDGVEEKAEITPKSMIDATIRIKDESIFVDLRVFSFLMILNLQYLLKLAEFFTVDIPDTQKPKVSDRHITSSASMQTQSRSSHRISVASKPPKEPMTVINLCIEKPDIILVENLDDINTNALILEMESTIKIRLVGNTQQVITGTVKDLQLFTCCYNPEKRHETKAQVLRPVSISLAGSTPNKSGLHLDLCTTNIHLSVSPGTIELLNRCYSALYNEVAQVEDDEAEKDDFSDVWEASEFKDSDFWFLRSEEADDALELFKSESEVSTTKESSNEDVSEICLISIPTIVITIEAGIGSHTLPMLLLESSVKGTVNDWSSQLTAEMQITLQIGYYNSRLALWEPMIEPIEVIRQSVSQFFPWELSLKFEKHEIDARDGPIDSDSANQTAKLLTTKHPLSVIVISSEETMEMTVSKTCMEVLQSLGASFNDAIYKPSASVKAFSAPYVLKNDIGVSIVLILESIPFYVYGVSSEEDVTEVLIEPNAEVSLYSVDDPSTSALTFPSSTSMTVNEKYLIIKIKNMENEIEIPVTRAEKRYFPVVLDESVSEKQGIISDVSVADGSITITLCSIIRIHNHFKEEVSIYFMTKKGNEVQLVGSVKPESHLNLPLQAVYTPTNEIFFSVPGYTVSLSPYIWKDLQKTLTLTKILQCNSKNIEDKEPFFIKALGEMEQVYYEYGQRHTMASTCYNIHLRATVILKNFLPTDIIVCVQGLAKENCLASGERLEIPTAEPGSSSIVIRISGYLDKEWSCKHSISENPPELEVWTFESYDSPQRITFDLGMHAINKQGSLVLALYCPFWMINKTGLSLCYRLADDMSNILYHPVNYQESVMFSFQAKNFFRKKKACIKVQNGEWSEKFSLDVAGSFGVVSCKVKDKIYQIGVHIELTYNTLTKQVILTPYHILINHCSRVIECCEGGRTEWLKVESNSCLPFWPNPGAQKNLVVRIEGTTEESISFPYNTTHSTLLKLENKYGGISVEIQMTEGAVYISFSDFKQTLAPALLINYTSHDIVMCEKNTDARFTLPSKHKKLFCWSTVRDNKQITWGDGKYSSDLRMDVIGDYVAEQDIKAYYVSFLDGMQSILLFTNDASIAKGAQSSDDMTFFDQDLTFSLHGVGLSLVDNISKSEILYLGITSSGVIWETAPKKKTRFKPLSTIQMEMIEETYQSYLQEKQLGLGIARRSIDDKIEVDFEEGLMIRPHSRIIRRTYSTGLWLQMKTSKHQLQLHAKVNRLQIDNQMYDCVFPVVLAPVPPPKSVSLANVLKPFAEVSIVQRINEHSTVRQYKYFKVLIQEFHIKLDIGFINAIVNFLEAGEVSDALEANQFELDHKLAKKPLMDHVSVISSQQQKNFYDFLHFSPLKIHLSFSLSSGGNSAGISGLPPVLSVLTQSLGVTLTDMQDVVFKLSYFERQCTFLSQRQLISEAQMHYTGQFFKQVYVLVFGLDVLGNPYGLVIGLKQGVEALFYEPFQGAIQGPGEFAEGFYYGVRSLFGHTIGGAAGAMSRITGAMGKGLAALTFDEEYQRKRREQMNTASSSGVQESMAQSGKGLVMGVVQGFGGVFTKPISGAKEEGVEGFFKGFGKGMVGLVTRPTAGVVDFASGTFSSVKKLSQLQDDVSRMRNPRKLGTLLRPFSRLEAEGQKLLMEVDKGRLNATDSYIYHMYIGQKDILILTDKRIAYLCHNDVFGGHQIDWSYTWEELADIPKTTDNGIIISIAEPKKKFFKSTATKKILLINNPEQKQILLTKIKHCMTVTTSVHLGSTSTQRASVSSS